MGGNVFNYIMFALEKAITVIILTDCLYASCILTSNVLQ